MRPTHIQVYDQVKRICVPPYTHTFIHTCFYSKQNTTCIHAEREPVSKFWGSRATLTTKSLQALILSLMPLGHLTTFPYWACSDHVRLRLRETDKVHVYLFGEMGLNLIPSLCKIIATVLSLARKPIYAHKYKKKGHKHTTFLMHKHKKRCPSVSLPSYSHCWGYFAYLTWHNEEIQYSV